MIIAEDSVGLGAYNMDSHNCQRIVKNGRVENEGDVQVGVKPYPISYRAIVPKAHECENLFVPVCLAASHIAYGSIRMEPVFMILGQSAATAASIALTRNLPAQKVAYETLRTRLVADQQVLTWTNGAGAGMAANIDPNTLKGIVLDDSDGMKSGFRIENGFGFAPASTNPPWRLLLKRHASGFAAGSALFYTRSGGEQFVICGKNEVCQQRPLQP